MLDIGYRVAMRNVTLIEQCDIEKEIDSALHTVALVEFPLLGRIEVRGADRLDLLHRLSTNTLLAAKSGEIIPTVFTTDKGRIVDFVRVVVHDSSLLLLLSHGNEENFAKWIERYTIMEDIRLTIVSDSTEMISLVGPEANDLAARILGLNFQPNTSVTKSLSFGEVRVTFRNEFATQFVDLIVQKKDLSHLHNLLQSDKIMKITPAGYEAFRIARGIPQLDNELTDAYNPYEVGLAGAISFSKGCYIGQEVIARLDTYRKVQKHLCGIVCTRGPVGPHAGSPVEFNGETIGAITSVSVPVQGRLAALAVVKRDSVAADNHVGIVCGDRFLEGVVASLPITGFPDGERYGET